MPRFPLAVQHYWQRVFGEGSVVGTSGGVSITVNPRLDRRRRAMVLRRADGETRVALTPALARQSGLDGDPTFDLDTLRARLAAGGITLHDPDCLFYFAADAGELRPTGAGSSARLLTEEDRAAFEAFQQQASERDREDAFVELGHWLVFGAFDGRRLVSVASMYPWDGSALADLGVLTLPDARGKGYARSVVRAICRHARTLGHEPQYRCQVDNVPSVALARASGFTLFGTWEVIRSED